MFGLVTASPSELTKPERERYESVYCGICRAMGTEGSLLCRLGLSYDMAFLAIMLMSLYEPPETSGSSACLPHPVSKRPWVDGPYIRYAARMNIALAYFKAKDDWRDDHSLRAGVQAGIFRRAYPALRRQYPRQCRAIEDCITGLSALEKENCPNPDEPANCFGQLMAELLVVDK